MAFSHQLYPAGRFRRNKSKDKPLCVCSRVFAIRARKIYTRVRSLPPVLVCAYCFYCCYVSDGKRNRADFDAAVF